MMRDATGELGNCLKCDKCGSVESRGSRVGMTCNQGLPRGGYCDGTLQNAAYFAAQAATAEQRGPKE